MISILFRQLFLIILLLTAGDAFSQRRFIKVNSDIGYGEGIRIIPSDNEGWITASMDSLRITKFDKCGKIIWSKKYLLPNTHSRLNDIISLRTGGFLLLTRRYNTILDKYFCVLSRIDNAGDFVWCKSYEDNHFDHYGYSLDEFANGDLFLYGNVGYVNTSGYNMICKLNGNGNIIWTKFYDHGGTYGGGIVTDDQGMLIRTGDTFIKTDVNGGVLWTTAGSSAGTYHYTTPLEVSDGYIYTKYKTGSSQLVFYKLDRQGVITQGSARISNYAGDYPMLKLTPAGNVAGIANQGNYPVLVEMDKNLNVLRQGAVDYNGQGFFANDFCFTGNEAVIAGSTSNSQMFFAKLDDLYKSSCDITLPLMQFNFDTTTQVLYSTNVSSYQLTEVNHVFPSIDVSDRETTLCTNPLEMELGADIKVCQSTGKILRNNLLGLWDEYEWSTGESTSYIHVTEPGQYWVKATQYCEDSVITDTITISVDSVPEAGWEMEITQCEDSSVVLHAPDCAQCTFLWNTGETSDSLHVNQSGRYSLIIENQSHCQNIESIDVEFGKCECDFYIPNSFTPNHDGINEVFKPVYYCDMENFEMKIFNRWGELVYQTTSAEEGWTGVSKNKNGVEAVYNYILSYTPLIKGKPMNAVQKSGMVALIY